MLFLSIVPLKMILTIMIAMKMELFHGKNTLHNSVFKFIDIWPKAWNKREPKFSALMKFQLIFKLTLYFIV